MSKELIAALDALEKENGISKEVMFEAIEKSLMDEYKTQFNTVENGRVVLDRITGDFHIYSDRQVVEEVSVPEPAEGSNSRKILKSIFLQQRFPLPMQERLSQTARLVTLLP